MSVIEHRGVTATQRLARQVREAALREIDSRSLPEDELASLLGLPRTALYMLKLKESWPLSTSVHVAEALGLRVDVTIGGSGDGASETPPAASLLQRAADALADAAWVMEGAKTEPPLPPPVTLVLPQTRRVAAEIREFLDARDEWWRGHYNALWAERKALREALKRQRMIDRSLIVGDVAVVAACIIMAALGDSLWLLIVAVLPAFAAYALISDGGWNRGR